MSKKPRSLDDRLDAPISLFGERGRARDRGEILTLRKILEGRDLEGGFTVKIVAGRGRFLDVYAVRDSKP